MPACYRVWDLWIDSLEKTMVDTAGHYIPLLLSIGNHEGGGFHQKKSELFNTWFPQTHTDDSSKQLTYHSHKISENTVVFVLDSHVIAEMGKILTNL